MKTTPLVIFLGLVLLPLKAADPVTKPALGPKPPATAWLAGSDEERFDRVARQLRGFDMAMMEVGYRYTELCWAGQDKNWDYAKYQCEKIQHVIELAMQRRTNRAPSAQWFLTNGIPPMMAAIEAKDGGRFEKQMSLFTASCNTCHAMEKMPFVTVQMPERRLSPVRFNGAAQGPKP
jgi:hypothetical protein